MIVLLIFKSNIFRYHVLHLFAGECLYTLGELSNAKDYARRAVQLGKQESSYALLIKVLVADDDLRSAIAVSNAALE